jgi:hypothetical protein
MTKLTPPELQLYLGNVSFRASEGDLLALCRRLGLAPTHLRPR